MSEHPSYFVLDALKLGAALPQSQALTAAAHVKNCEFCAEYLAGVGASPRPAWLEGVSLAPAPVQPRARRWLLLAPVFAAFVLVAGAGLSFWPGQAPPREVRQKGGPTLRVFVKRGERVFVWNGREAVRPGDRLAFEIQGVGPGFVSVALRSAASTPVLYAGSLVAGRPQLPVSFVVDEVGSAEVVSVITAPKPIDPKLHAEAERRRSGAEPWRQILVFPKVVGGGDAGADSGSSTQQEPHHPEAFSP